MSCTDCFFTDVVRDVTYRAFQDTSGALVLTPPAFCTCVGTSNAYYYLDDAKASVWFLFCVTKATTQGCSFDVINNSLFCDHTNPRICLQRRKLLLWPHSGLLLPWLQFCKLLIVAQSGSEPVLSKNCCHLLVLATMPFEDGMASIF